MILEYGFKNYFSFRQGAEISFKLDGKVPRLFSNRREFTTVLGIKGANASGKTTVLKALQFLYFFIRWSFFSVGKGDPDEGFIMLDPFFNSDGPTEFYIEFVANGTHYRYELVATDKRVLRETIFKCAPKPTVYLQREDNAITVSPSEDRETLQSIILRSSASVVSTLTQHKTRTVNDFSNYFNNIISNVFFNGMHELPLDINETAKNLHEDPETAKFVEDFIRECDTGISRLDILETTNAKGEPHFMPIFLHSVGDKEFAVHAFTESSGTKALYRLLPRFKHVLGTGGLLVLDEIDAHLHPLLLPKLISLFLDPATNPNDAQLLFSTHDTRLLDQLGRYRTYLVNKEDNESYTYRLDEIQGDVLRNDRPIAPIYNDGRIGGIPRL